MTVFGGKGILLDVEGTTSSIAFVYDVLFAYAKEHIAAFLEQHATDPAVAEAAAALAAETGCSNSLDTADGRSSLVLAALDLINRDIKSTPLKALQGMIWRAGFESGQLTAHVFDDVPPALDDSLAVADDGHVHDVVLAGGRVIDPGSHFDAVAHVGIDGDTITRISLEPLTGTTTVDATVFMSAAPAMIAAFTVTLTSIVSSSTRMYTTFGTSANAMLPTIAPKATHAPRHDASAHPFVHPFVGMAVLDFTDFTGLFAPRSMSGSSSANIGFAISAEEALPILESLRLQAGGAPRQEGFLGVGLDDRTDGGLGALITDVRADTPADDAGIESGDIVIAIDGSPVEGVAGLIAAIRDLEPGDSTEITLRRGDRVLDLLVVLTSRPDS